MNKKLMGIRNHDSDFNNGSETMSEKVQLLANSIYKEFERMINHFGSEVLECLMPLIVGVLENLDELYKSKQSDELEIEIIKEDNITLSNQYDKEKSLRKQAEERLFDAEFVFEEEKKRLLERNQEIESMLRISELKLRGSHDFVIRLEEKEKELKYEHQKLHERYTDTFKSHGDLLQRLKRCNFSVVSPLPPQNLNVKRYKSSETPNDETIDENGNEIDPPQKFTNKAIDEYDYSPPNINIRDTNSRGETVAEIYGDDEWITDSISESLFLHSQRHIPSDDIIIQNQKNEGNSNFVTFSVMEDDMGTAENSLEFNNADSDTDLTDDEFGIRKEIESLIKENQDLVDTKNALNIVKDDLIGRLDILTSLYFSENDLLREDIHKYLNKQADLTAKVAYLENELKKSKKEIRKLKEIESETKTIAIENKVEQKSFSRSEMAVLLQERNHFKERLLELQDALVYTEMMRVKKQFPDQYDSTKTKKQNNSSVWNFFKNVRKTKEEGVPIATQENSKLLKARFRLENNRSQLYSWSIPRALIESSLPKRIPIPIKIQRVFEPKDVVICSSLGFDECPSENSATFLWCLTQSINKQYNLVHISLCAKQPELIQKRYINLQFPTNPFTICEVPALIYVIKELGLIRSSGDEDNTGAMNCKPEPTETTKMTQIFHTKVHIKQKSKCIIGSKTLWFGCEKKQLVVFVLFDNSKLEGRMATANLPSEIDFMKYHAGRIFVMTKNGSLCIFDLNKELNQWDLHQCLVMDVCNGLPIGTSCCDQDLLLLWLGSSTDCFVVNLTYLTVQKSWTVTEDSPSMDPCTAIESIVKLDKLSLMLLAISRIGSVIGYDVHNFELKLFIDLRPCVFDLIEPVAGLTTLSIYHLVDDGERLWMSTDCGMILIVTVECLKSHLNSRKSKISLQGDEVLISAHAFVQCVKSICLLSYSSSSLAIGDQECSKFISDSNVAGGKIQSDKSLLMTAIGSCYVNLNNTMSDILNLSNRAIIWKI